MVYMHLMMIFGVHVDMHFNEEDFKDVTNLMKEEIKNILDKYNCSDKVDLNITEKMEAY